ncbi:hypothetical protein DLR61_15675 [Vibrio tarriae]|nr:hypothetical protein DLR61_15675 [Vibrio tarriae]
MFIPFFGLYQYIWRYLTTRNARGKPFEGEFHKSFITTSAGKMAYKEPKIVVKLPIFLHRIVT